MSGDRNLTVRLTVGTTVTLSQIPNVGNLHRNSETRTAHGILAGGTVLRSAKQRSSLLQEGAWWSWQTAIEKQLAEGDPLENWYFALSELVSELCSGAWQPVAVGSVPATELLCPLWYAEGMKSKYLLILEGETGKGFSAWLPDLPGIYAAGDSQRQVEVLAKVAADDEVAERDTLPAPPLRTSR